MSDADRLSRLRHDLSNPLSALLAETQLLLLNEAKLDHVSDLSHVASGFHFTSRT